MDLSQVQKKLAEAQFFLKQMVNQERQESGLRLLKRGEDPFDYYLSAFLNAGRTVDYRLRREYKGLYEPWRKAWNVRLAPEEDQLIEFMIKDRIAEVHESGSGRDMSEEAVWLPSLDEPPKSALNHIVGEIANWADIGPPGFPIAAFLKARCYYFTIGGTHRAATEACKAYVALLQRLVTNFEADHS